MLPNGFSTGLKLLLDEHLSPRLVPRAAALGIAASHVAHIGRSGSSDVALWRYAYASDAAVATTNVRDFLLLARDVELHPGLLVLRRSGLTPEGQWQHLEPALRYWIAEARAGRSLVNRVVEIRGVGDLNILDMPS